MAYTKTITEDGSFVITAGSNALSVFIQKANALHQWETWAINIAISASEAYTVGYTEDGLYNVHVTEAGVTTSFYNVYYKDIRQSLLSKIINVINYPERIKCMNYDKYDFVAMFLLGLRFIGGNDFTSHSLGADQLYIPINYRPVNDAIRTSIKYTSEFITKCKCC